jgi:predicted small lipoprotein YifL
MMRKAFLVVLVALMLVAVMVVGCGEKKPAGESADAKMVLEESTEKMQEVDSMKASGSYEMTTETEGAEQMDLSFQMEMDLSDPNDIKGRMIMKGMGQDIDVYMSGGYAYTQVPDRGWVKTPLDTQSMSQPTPEEIKKFADNAENLKITSEDDTSYTLEFDLSRDFVEEQIQEQGEVTEGASEYTEMVEAIVNSMTMGAKFKIAKDSMFIEETQIKMDVTDMPMVGDMSLDMKMEFSDYNQPVTVALPPEAASATEVEAIPGTSGGVPGFPGMGF